MGYKIFGLLLAGAFLTKSAHATESCPAPGAYAAVDLSMPVNQPFLDKLKTLQVSTVIRYYDHLNETIRGKTLLPSETELLAKNGFEVAVVFQHNNNKITSFTTARGNADSRRSLDLASQNRQPTGSAIYFGVDGGWSSSKDISAIKKYFSAASVVVRNAGFKVGAYGSGLVCQQLMDAGLTDYCWLSNARGWPGFDSFHASSHWVLTQSPPRNCGGKNVDFDFGNEADRDAGQFRP
jgi:hypothetical protein